jgi:long-chain acyl-CoA synthetase
MPMTSIRLKPFAEVDEQDSSSPQLQVSELKEGVLWVKGPGVMRGYLHDDAATQSAFDSDGYFNTGDIASLLDSQHLVITGRAKDTIVLLNGENVSPSFVEETVLQSSSLAIIDQLMVCGQDQRALAAVIVVKPSALVEQGLVSSADAQRMETALKDRDQAAIKQWNQELSKNLSLRNVVQSDLDQVR